MGIAQRNTASRNQKNTSAKIRNNGTWLVQINLISKNNLFHDPTNGWGVPYLIEGPSSSATNCVWGFVATPYKRVAHCCGVGRGGCHCEHHEHTSEHLHRRRGRHSRRIVNAGFTSPC